MTDCEDCWRGGATDQPCEHDEDEVRYPAWMERDPMTGEMP